MYFHKSFENHPLRYIVGLSIFPLLVVLVFNYHGFLGDIQGQGAWSAIVHLIEKAHVLFFGLEIAVCILSAALYAWSRVIFYFKEIAACI